MLRNSRAGLALIALLFLFTALAGCANPVSFPDKTSISAASASPAIAAITPTDEVFYIYKDADFSGNHFISSGYMGDIDSISIITACKSNPYSGSTCVEVDYYPKGNNRWAGVYWQEPPNNWGTEPAYEGKGFNLSAYKKLTFYARSDDTCYIDFIMGGVGRPEQPYGDSLDRELRMTIKLTREWTEYEFDLTGADLSYVISGFGWVTNLDHNPNGAFFYIDDVKYEK